MTTPTLYGDNVYYPQNFCKWLWFKQWPKITGILESHTYIRKSMDSSKVHTAARIHFSLLCRCTLIQMPPPPFFFSPYTFQFQWFFLITGQTFLHIGDNSFFKVSLALLSSSFILLFMIHSEKNVTVGLTCSFLLMFIDFL